MKEMKAILVFVVAALMISLPLTSSINYSAAEPKTEVHILQYCDGTVKEIVKELSVREARELQKKLNDISLPMNPTEEEMNSIVGERLRVLKEYNLIAGDVTAEQLRSGMEERAKALEMIGITREKLLEKLPMIIDATARMLKGSEVLKIGKVNPSIINKGLGSIEKLSPDGPGTLGWGLHPVAYNLFGMTVGAGVGTCGVLGMHSIFPLLGIDVVATFLGGFWLRSVGLPSFFGMGLLGCIWGFTGFLTWMLLPSIYGPCIQMTGYHLMSVWIGAFSPTY
jgi:hypothetical protein